MKRTIRREKAKHLPKSPVSLSDLELTGEWTTTGGVDKEDFLIHDSGPESASRILVLASQSALTHLASADKWYMVHVLKFRCLFVCLMGILTMGLFTNRAFHHGDFDHGAFDRPGF